MCDFWCEFELAGLLVLVVVCYLVLALDLCSSFCALGGRLGLVFCGVDCRFNYDCAWV